MLQRAGNVPNSPHVGNFITRLVRKKQKALLETRFIKYRCWERSNKVFINRRWRGVGGD